MDLNDVNEKLYLYNPKDDSSIQALIDSYPEFQEDLEKLEKHKFKIARFIILFYDLNNDIKGLVPEFWKRKSICAELSGFKLNDEKHFPNDVKEFLIGNNEHVNSMIIRYLLLFNNPDYIELEVATDLYNKQARKAMQTKISANATTIKAINDNLTSLNKKIKETTELVFGGKESHTLTEMLYSHMEKDRLELRPEDIAIKSDGDDELSEADIYKIFD